MHKMLRRILVLAFLLCMISQAWAAQTLIRTFDNSSGSYLSTPTKVYSANGWVYKFSVDGYTYYPNEIYLPNEQNPASYRIHSNYTKNTDACASCHATHTAVGDSLLQWYSSYETCMACHDGTVTTTYNVVEGMLPNGQLAKGGAFGSGNEDSTSYHNVTGGVLIASAPGNELSVGTKNNDPLQCTSCHNPHGLGGNARLLNPDPNGVQSKQAANFKNYPLIQIGKDDTVGMVIYAAYPKKPDNSFNTMLDPYYILKGYPYQINVYINGNAYNSFFMDNSAGYSIIKISKNDLNGPVTADFIPSLRVRMNITNYLGASGNEQIQYRDGSVKFCSACHADYNYQMGVSSGVYKHPVDVSIYDYGLSINTSDSTFIKVMQYKFESNAKIVCLTCHYAHGTSSDYWQKSLGLTPTDAHEIAGSSALKLAPNSGICEICHQKGSANEGYNANTYQPHNNPIYDVYDASFTQSLGIAGYIGGNLTSCAGGYGVSCHQPIVDTWQSTLHAKSLQNNSFIISGAVSSFTVETGLNVSQVAYVIGSKWKQRYIWNNNGILQVAPSEYIVSTNTWNTKGADNDFVKDCAGCHVTGLNTAKGSWSDNSIACEACHGAAKNHNLVPSNRNITNPRYLAVNDQTDVCAQCHTFGYNNADQPSYRPYPVGYMPYGEGLNSTGRAVYTLNHFFTPYTINDYPGNFYKNSNVNSATYDSDLSPQEFNDFVQSKHYQSGVISCVTCHSAHKKNADGKMLKLTFEQTCGSCHGTSFDINAVMPKRISITNNPADKLRVHTFASQHDTSNIITGPSISIH